MAFEITLTGDATEGIVRGAFETLVRTIRSDDGAITGSLGFADAPAYDADDVADDYPVDDDESDADETTEETPAEPDALEG